MIDASVGESSGCKMHAGTVSLPWCQVAYRKPGLMACSQNSSARLQISYGRGSFRLQLFCIWMGRLEIAHTPKRESACLPEWQALRQPVEIEFWACKESEGEGRWPQDSIQSVSGISCAVWVGEAGPDRPRAEHRPQTAAWVFCARATLFWVCGV